MEWKSVRCLPSCSHKPHRWVRLLPTVMPGPAVTVLPKYRNRSSEMTLTCTNYTTYILLLFSVQKSVMFLLEG